MKASLFMEKKHSSFVHCCVQKTASQWFFALYSNPLFQSLTGLEVLPFTRYVEACAGLPDWRRDAEFYRLAYHGLRFSADFPDQTIGCPFYIGYETFRRMTGARLRAIFVTRDPRDLLLSGYFSMRDSHPEMEANDMLRSRIRELPFPRGMAYYLDYLLDLGLFQAQRSWHVAARQADDGAISLLRYEDLADRYDVFFPDLMRVFGLQPDCEEAKSLKNSFAFDTQRNSGTFPEGHLRRGKSGEWREKFTPEIMEIFTAKTGNLLDELGYADAPSGLHRE